METGVYDTEPPTHSLLLLWDYSPLVALDHLFCEELMNFIAKTQVWSLTFKVLPGEARTSLGESPKKGVEASIQL